jgi:hypothetical protein
MRPKPIKSFTFAEVIEQAQQPRDPLTPEQIAERDRILRQLSGVSVVVVSKEQDHEGN